MEKRTFRHMTHFGTFRRGRFAGVGFNGGGLAGLANSASTFALLGGFLAGSSAVTSGKLAGAGEPELNPGFSSSASSVAIVGFNSDPSAAAGPLLSSFGFFLTLAPL